MKKRIRTKLSKIIARSTTAYFRTLKRSSRVYHNNCALRLARFNAVAGWTGSYTEKDGTSYFRVCPKGVDGKDSHLTVIHKFVPFKKLPDVMWAPYILVDNSITLTNLDNGTEDKYKTTEEV